MKHPLPDPRLSAAPSAALAEPPEWVRALVLPDGRRFWQAADVVMFAQTAFTLWPEDGRWLDATPGAYATSAPEGAMAAVGRVALSSARR